MKLLNTKTFTLLLSASAILSMTGCSGDGENGAASEKNLLTEGQPPVAVAEVTPVTIVCPSANPVKVMYDGSKSNDTDGEIVSYSWFIHMGGKDEPISNQVKGEIADTCKAVGDQRGTYEVGLTVEDNDGNRVTDMVEVKVVDNKPPVAQAGADKAIEKGVSITLDGKDSSDPDGQILKYSWNIDGTVTEAMTVSTPTTWSAGDHTATLTVTDDVGNTDSDTVVITVVDNPTNLPPEAKATADEAVYQCTYNTTQDIMLDASGSSDPEGDTLSFDWVGKFSYEDTYTINIVDSTSEKATTPLDVLCEKCDRDELSDDDDNCELIFNVDVSDGVNPSDNADVTVKIHLIRYES